MKSKMRVGILMGGPSSEHEVSLKTGEMIAKNLDATKFEASPVLIKKDGSWPMTLENFKNNFDVAFIAMHGAYGEDGQVQNLLATFKIPHTGSGAVASALAMDKNRTMMLLKNHCLVPAYAVLEKSHPRLYREKFKSLGLPLVVKPNNGGSSIGIHIVEKWPDLENAIADSFKYGEKLIIQKYIPGRELSCGTLEVNGVLLPLMPTEIIPVARKFFDYTAKYQENASKEITPPELPKNVIKKIQQTALLVHRLIGCQGMSRTDMILDKNGNLHVLETNTIPGLTETSLLPKQAAALGISFPKLLEHIIQSSYGR